MNKLMMMVLQISR